MIRIDQVINSERILETKQYQTKRCFISEERWLTKYMIKSGYIKNDIFNVIKELYISKIDYSPSQEEVESYFENRIWQKVISNKTKLFRNREIKIYKEELDYINSKTTLPWIKELSLLVLACFKFYNSKVLYMGKVPFKELIPITSLKRRRDGSNSLIWSRMREYSLIDYETENYTCKPFCIRDDGEVVISINTMADLYKLCPLIKNEKICTICGCSFEYNSKTKRDVCLKCWKHNEVLKSINRRNKRCSGESVNILL